MSIQDLTILSSMEPGIRDLYWVDDPNPKVIGYNVYRAFDAPMGWAKVNPFGPVPGHSFRDQSHLESKVYTVKPTDWVEKGGQGRYIFKLPDIPYAEVVQGRPSVACQPDDIRLYVDGVLTRCGRVDGMDRTVWLQQTVVLHQTGDRRERPTTLVNDATVIQVEYLHLLNSVSIAIEGVRTFYSVVPVTHGGVEVHAPGAPGTEIQDTFQVDRMDYMQAEMIRRQKWLLEQRAEPVYLMVRRTKGEPCFCAKASGEPRTGCDACYQTGIVGGYYGPIDFLFVDPDSAATIETEEGGKKVTRESQAFTVPAPMIQSGDLLVRRNGERWVIGPVTYKTHRGVLLQQDYSASVLMHNDVRYKIPLTQQTGEVFHPAFEESSTADQPVSDPRKDPTKTWENPKIPMGRTVTFGNIQT